MIAEITLSPLHINSGQMKKFVNVLGKMALHRLSIEKLETGIVDRLQIHKFINDSNFRK